MSNSNSDRDDIQTKVFTSWANEILNKRQLSIENLADGFSSGFMLINLIEILWNEPIGQKYNSNPRFSYHKMQNIQMALDFLTKKKVKIVGVSADDIEKGSKSAILSLMCSIINGYIDQTKFDGKEGKKGLLKWCKEVTHGNKDINFTSIRSTCHELTFCAIVHHFQPNAINYDQISSNDSMNNSKIVINAYKKLGIKAYIDENELANINDEIVIELLYLQLYIFFVNDEKTVQSQQTKQGTTEHKINEIPHPESHGHKFNKDETPFLKWIGKFKKSKSEKTFISLPKPSERKKAQFASCNLLKTKNEDNLANYINECYGDPKTTVQREPVLVAKINNDTHQVDFDENAFNEIMNYAGSRPIISIAGIGGFQEGKSTTLSGLTGNLQYVVGDGNGETTKGVYIDGPYDIDYLYKRFNIEPREDVIFLRNEDLKPVIYFFDIEGFGGNMHSDDDGQNKELYKKLCSPFACISSVFFMISNPNIIMDGIDTVIEALSINKLSNDDEEDGNGAVKIVLGIKNYNCPPFKHYKTEEELVSLINDENMKNAVNKISEDCKNFQKFEKYGISTTFSPMISPNPMAMQGYVKSFWFFARDIIRSIEVALDGNFTRDAERNINLFNFIAENYDNSNFEIMLQNKISEEHEKSLQRISERLAYETYNVLLKPINDQYEINENHPEQDKDIQTFCDSLKKMGRERIKEKLGMIEDSPVVQHTLEQFYDILSQYLSEKEKNLKIFKDKYFEEQKTKAIAFADQKMDEEIPKSKDSILIILKKNNFFEFNVKLIEKPVADEAHKFSNYLQDEFAKMVIKQIQEKQIEDENYKKQLLDKKMDDLKKFVIQNEYDVFYNKLLAISKDLIIQEQKDQAEKAEKNGNIKEFKQHVEEITKKQLEAHNENEEASARHMIITKAEQELNQLYSILEENEVEIMKNQFLEKDFYLQNYTADGQTKLKIKINESIHDTMMNEKNEIIDQIFNTYKEQKNVHIDAIKRVISKEKDTIIPKEKIDLIITLKSPAIEQDIRNCIYEAKENLTEIEYEKKNFNDDSNRNIIIVKTRRILHYPDGTTVNENWEEARRKPRHFKIKKDKTHGKIIKISKKDFEYEHKLGAEK